MSEIRTHNFSGDIQLYVGGLMSYLCFLCLFAYSGVFCFVLFVFVLCLVYPMLPVSLDCPCGNL